MSSLANVHPELRERVQGMLREEPRLWIESAYRSPADQQRLYNLFIAGKGAPANRPGTSKHERNPAEAVDVGSPHVLNPVRARLAKRWGLTTPFAKEPWHMELDPRRGPKPSVSPIRQPTKEAAMTMVIEPVGARPVPNGNGGLAFGRRGHVYHWGQVPVSRGWDERTRANPDRVCVDLVWTATGMGYWLVSNWGEVYAYGDAPQVGNYRAKEWGAGVIIGAFCNPTVPITGGLTLVRDDDKRLNTYALPA